MANTFFGLNIGSTGLYAAKSGLNVTAHNVANIETEGYSRQVIKQSAATPLSTNNRYGMLGSGVELDEITRMRSQYYDDKYRSNNGLLGMYETRSDYMNEVQSYLNEIELEGFTTTFDSFFDSLQELSKDPANLTVRTQVKNHALSMCEYFNSLSSSLNQVQAECNYEIKNQVSRINSLAGQVATLTKQINIVEIGGESANDLRDQRENLIDELSNMANITVSEREVGKVGMTEYIVRLDGQILVDNYEFRQLEAVPRTKKMNQSDIDGLYDIYWSNGERMNVESSTLTGSLKAVFEVRDGNNKDNLHGIVEEVDAGATQITVIETNVNEQKNLNIPAEGRITIGNGEYAYTSFSVTANEDGTYSYTFELEDEARRQYEEGTQVSVGITMDYKGVPYYQYKLNEFLRVFAQEFNEVHASGTNLNGDTGVNFFSAINPMTAEEYKLNSFGAKGEENVTMSDFDSDPLKTEVPYYMLTASNLTINQSIQTNPSCISAATDITNGIGNADNVNKLIKLKDDISMFEQGDPAAFLQALVGEVGVDTQAVLSFAESQQNIVRTITSQRLSVAGVDIDEEAMNLAKYQEAYNLAAKVIAVMNETYDTLINTVI